MFLKALATNKNFLKIFEGGLMNQKLIKNLSILGHFVKKCMFFWIKRTKKTHFIFFDQLYNFLLIYIIFLIQNGIV